MNWTRQKLKAWREELGYGKYKMAAFIGVTHEPYSVLERAFIIPDKRSDELDTIHHDWIREKDINPFHNKVQRAILRELNLDHLIVRKIAV